MIGGAVLFLVGAPFLGGLVAGADRIISARMQARVGPPLLQPFYDVLKLFEKRAMVAGTLQVFFVSCFLLFVMLTGAVFFSGGDLLLVVFSLTVAAVFLVLAAYSPNSPYSDVGAERELLQMMSYEPVVLVTMIGMYLVTGSFSVADIVAHPRPLLFYIPGMLAAFLVALTVKLRKSPFDLSGSHHPHQELVRGITTELSGPTLALVEIAHWYETVLLLGMVYLFFAALPLWAALALVLGVYFLEILADNVYARQTWWFTLRTSWFGAGALATANLLVVFYLLR